MTEGRRTLSAVKLATFPGARLDAAAKAKEAPEVLYALMGDVAAALDAIGAHATAESVRRSAATLRPMFGMRRRWWQRRTPDHAERIRYYREEWNP